jgi:hypothetical protein
MSPSWTLRTADRRATGATVAAFGIAMALIACEDVLGLDDLTSYETLDDGPSDGSSDTQSSDVGAADAGSENATDSAAQDVAQDSAGPGCDSGFTSCDGGCVDLSMDRNNCGFCGHDCLGGGCSAKQCQPVALTHNAQVWDLATDGTNLYWTDFKSTVQQCAIASCTPAPIKTGQAMPARLAYDAGRLYWTVYGSNTSASGEIWVYDGASASSLVSTPQYQPEGIGVDAADLFWADIASNQLMKAPRTGGAATQLGPMQSQPASIVIDAGIAYWTNSKDGTVRKCSTASCSPSAIAAGHVSPWGITVDANSIYWTDLADNGSIWRADHDGGGKAQLGPVQANPLRIISDGGHLFWTASGTAAKGFLDGSVMTCLATSCTTPSAMTMAASYPAGLTTDSKAVYYGTYGDNTLWMVAK